MKRQPKIILASVAALLIFQSMALGCECDQLPKNSTAFRKANAVFIGDVIGITKQPPRPLNWGDDQAPLIDVVTFKVEKSWKGARRPEVAIWLDFSFLNCTGMRFREGEKYLVYAEEHKGIPVMYWCGHAGLSTPLASDEARKQIRQLDSFWFRTRARLLPI